MAVEFPPRNETLDFLDRLNREKYQAIGAPLNQGMYVDNEGIAVWMQQYLLYRVNGLNHIDAAVKVFQEIDAIRAPKPPAGPFRPAPRYWEGVNMCGVRVPGLPPVSGGAPDPTLFLSWFYDRYDAATRTNLRVEMRSRFATHWLLSWPDSRAQGATPSSFRALCQELIADGFYPCVMLTSKDFDPKDVNAIMSDLRPLLAELVGLVPMFCIGWELSIWLSPEQVQQLIDAVAPLVHQQPQTWLYVHFQEGYSSFQLNGKSFADFWNTNIGKLNGVLHQRVLSQTKNQYQFDSGGLHDVLERFAGGWNCSGDDGTGHPFDLVAFEITAMKQFSGEMSEAEGNTWGDTALATPPVNGVRVMGSGNGHS